MEWSVKRKPTQGQAGAGLATDTNLAAHGQAPAQVAINPYLVRSVVGQEGCPYTQQCYQLHTTHVTACGVDVEGLAQGLDGLMPGTKAHSRGTKEGVRQKLAHQGWPPKFVGPLMIMVALELVACMWHSAV